MQPVEPGLTIEEKKRRVEAARAYAEISSQDELGERLGYKPPKFRRHLLGLGGELGLKELLAVADACGVPDWFMLAGWTGALRATERGAGANADRVGTQMDKELGRLEKESELGGKDESASKNAEEDG